MKWHSTFLINQPSVLHLTGFTLLSEILAQWNERMWMRETWCVDADAVCCLLFAVFCCCCTAIGLFFQLLRLSFTIYKTSLLCDVLLMLFSFHFICPLFCSYIYRISYTVLCFIAISFCIVLIGTIQASSIYLCYKLAHMQNGVKINTKRSHRFQCANNG